MPSSKSVWLDVRNGVNELLLQEYHQQYREEFWSRDDEKPQMLMLIGDKSKAISMRTLFALDRKDEPCKICLRKVHNETDPKSPLLIADCGLHNANTLERALGGPVPADIDQRRIAPTWHETRSPSNPLEISILLYGRLISIFSTVICLFADDIGGLDDAARWVSLWLRAGCQRLDLPHSGYPHVLVLKEWNRDFDEKAANVMFMNRLREETQEKNIEGLIAQQFRAVRVLPLPIQNKQKGYDWTTIREFIQRVSSEVRICRMEANLDFSARQLKALFHAACDHLAANWGSPFSFIAATRSRNPVPSDFATHLMTFLKNTSDIKNFAVPIIASALNLDSHPPGMHSFHPAKVFERLYFPVFEKIKRNLYPNNAEIFSEIYGLIKEEYLQQVNQTIHRKSAAAHKAVLARFRSRWEEMYSYKTCFACVARGAEKTLSCRHSLCELCIIRDTDPYELWECTPNRCILCQKPNTVTFSIKPYTAGTRGLSIGDLEQDSIERILAEVQVKLPLKNCTLDKYFDIVVGTGAGATYVLGMICNGWSLTRCIENLKTLNQAHELRLMKRWRRRWVSRGSLKDFFGSGTLFEYNSHGTKVLIAATGKDGSICVFSNYNGAAQRPSTCGRMIRPENIKEEALIYKLAIGRWPLSGLRDFHDPPNTDNILIRLEQDVIWSRENKKPDFLICFNPVPANIAPVRRSFNEDVPHLLRQPSTPRYANEDPSIRQDFWPDFLPSFFYLELSGLPKQIGSQLSCRLQIRCRLAPSPELQNLIMQLRQQNARFYCKSNWIHCIDPQNYEKEKSKALAFSRCMTIEAMSRNERIDVKLVRRTSGTASNTEGRTEADDQSGQSISNCPYNLAALIHDQGLDCVFGHGDHRDP